MKASSPARYEKRNRFAGMRRREHQAWTGRGYSQALDIYQQCRESGLAVWCGGMIEFGVSRAHNIVLSTLEGFNLPGDLSSSATYWEQDLITEPITVQHGRIPRKNGAGIGVELDQRRMKEITLHNEIIMD
ncbi:enolase C-terminal domain-like protein [Rossellomorea sp. H39__3]